VGALRGRHGVRTKKNQKKRDFKKKHDSVLPDDKVQFVKLTHSREERTILGEPSDNRVEEKEKPWKALSKELAEKRGVHKGRPPREGFQLRKVCDQNSSSFGRKAPHF